MLKFHLVALFLLSMSLNVTTQSGLTLTIRNHCAHSFWIQPVIYSGVIEQQSYYFKQNDEKTSIFSSNSFLSLMLLFQSDQYPNQFGALEIYVNGLRNRFAFGAVSRGTQALDQPLLAASQTPDTYDAVGSWMRASFFLSENDPATAYLEVFDSTRPSNQSYNIFIANSNFVIEDYQNDTDNFPDFRMIKFIPHPQSAWEQWDIVLTPSNKLKLKNRRSKRYAFVKPNNQIEMNSGSFTDFDAFPQPDGYYFIGLKGKGYIYLPQYPTAYTQVSFSDGILDATPTPFRFRAIPSNELLTL